MLPGAIIWSEQWLLCKTALARGQGRLYFRSLACSLIAMLVGDVLLIPQWGIIGAAVASALAPLAGILAVKSILHQMNLTWMELLPRWADFAELSNQARQIARSFRATSGL
jgi:O-antigen/teichoic acid export membrane protein